MRSWQVFPLLFAALGELVERAGVLNIGLEGMMLFGAYAGFVVAYHGDSSWLGFGAGMLAGAVISLTMVLFCVRLGLDQIVVGIAIVLGAEGATALIFDSQFAESRPTLPAVSRVSIQGLSDLPVVGGKGESDGASSASRSSSTSASRSSWSAWMLRRTHLGLNVKAAGDRPDALDAAGVSVVATPLPGCSRARWRARRGLPRDRERGPVPGHARRRTRFHRDRAGDARPRPARWVVVGAFLFGASLSIADWAQVAGF